MTTAIVFALLLSQPKSAPSCSAGVGFTQTACNATLQFRVSSKLSQPDGTCRAPVFRIHIGGLPIRFRGRLGAIALGASSLGKIDAPANFEPTCIR